MLENNAKLLFFCAIFIFVKNLIVARLFAILSRNRPSIFLYDRKAIKQTFIIWAVATFSEFTGYILKYVFLCVSNASFIKTGGNILSRYFSVTVFSHPLICVLPFIISFGLCFLLILIFGKIMKIEKRVITALLISVLCAPYFIVLPMIDFTASFPFWFGVILILFLIPYFFYKHFSNLVYQINLKKDNRTADKRYMCMIFAFVGQFIGVFFLLILGIESDFALYIHDPHFSMQDTTYSEPYIPLIVFSVSVLIGALCNLLLMLRFCFTPKKPNTRKSLINAFALSVLNAPYVLFIIYYMFYFSR